MLILYRTEECPRCTHIEGVLQDLVLAHRVVAVTSSHELSGVLPEGTRLPVLVDGEEMIQGSDAIIKHLEELEKFKELWDKFQSDACYCDEEGNVE